MVANKKLAFLKVLPLLALVSCANASAGNDIETPRYLQYANDPAQSLYSKALLGYAVNEKCNFLSSSQKASFEQEMNQASSFFGAYLHVKGIASSQSEFSSYIEQMVRGSARGVGQLFPTCDDKAKSAVVSGQKALRDFNFSFKEQLK